MGVWHTNSELWGADKSSHSITLCFLSYNGETRSQCDLEDDVEASRRTIQRKLAEFAQLGYLTREDPETGLANEFTVTADSGVGEIIIPDVGGPLNLRQIFVYTIIRRLSGFVVETSASCGAGTGCYAQLLAPDRNQLDPPPESAG